MVKSISAVLPIYNVSAYLPRCLDSILATGYQDLEIVCVNDGSTDNSLDILRQYAARDSRFVVIDQPNGGISAARNAGILRATGEYVTFIDPDDYVHPRYFEILYDSARQHGADYVIGGYRTVEEKDLKAALSIPTISEFDEKPLSVDKFFQSHTPRTYIWGRLLKRSLTKKVLFDTSVPFGEDGIFNSTLLTVFPDLSVWFCDAPIYQYVQREGSAMSRSNDNTLFLVAVEYESRISGQPVSEQAFLLPAIRRGLTVRYLCTHIHPDRDLARRCKALLGRCAKRIRHANTISRKEKLLNWTMIRVPGLYWLYRVRQPGMWKWEKVERKKRRAAKKQR